MRIHCLFAAVLIFLHSVLFAADISSVISQCQFMIFAPSFEAVVSNSKSMIKRFYARNAVERFEQVSGESLSQYGVDVLDLKSLSSAGLDVKKPLAYVHVSENTGYLALPTANQKLTESFLRRNFNGNAAWKFQGGYVLISRDTNVLSLYKMTNLLENSPGFKLAAEKTGFQWDNFFIWMESRYLSDVSFSGGVSANLNIPYGFNGFIFQFLPASIRVRGYSGILSDKETGSVQSIRHVDIAEKDNVLDYFWGDPALIANMNINLPALYQNYTYIDSINILGLKSFLNDLMVKYRINVERDFLANSDGRVRIVVGRYDPQRGDYLISGSFGIKRREVAEALLESIKSAILQRGEKLYTFDLFTKPFYHYKSETASVFYGIMENEIYFSTDKDTLIKLVKNIHERQNGFLENQPDYFQKAVSEKKIGFFVQVDAQSFYSGVKTGLKLSPDFFTGVKEFRIQCQPDMGNKPYGWNLDADMIYYK